ncbi:hypothetical protein [Paenibacillus thiaminolyticus]|uniref:hypothetical protein n=1 Tax=Paenibacillus thiaminolyticus TaxID=49283 RepID=UPI002543308B|nr:hypothetical protein [Paenibacillus thiaminolyticus]WII35840.1 hypothetical protein O0V01_19385 [Paenibacillus thiaminolyticus]
MRQEAERVPFSLPCGVIRIIPFRLAKPSAPPIIGCCASFRAASSGQANERHLR